jgi:hypothetical protein
MARLRTRADRKGQATRRQGTIVDRPCRVVRYP